MPTLTKVRLDIQSESSQCVSHCIHQNNRHNGFIFVKTGSALCPKRSWYIPCQQSQPYTVTPENLSRICVYVVIVSTVSKITSQDSHLDINRGAKSVTTTNVPARCQGEVFHSMASLDLLLHCLPFPAIGHKEVGTKMCWGGWREIYGAGGVWTRAEGCKGESFQPNPPPMLHRRYSGFTPTPWPCTVM